MNWGELRGNRWRKGAIAGAAACATLASGEFASAADPPRPPAEVADMDIAELVKLPISPFEVAARLDRGYQASNAVSASRFDAPIRELPFAIQAFTESFIRDQKPVNLFDVARYSPGVTYRSNDFNEGNANLSIRGFVVGQRAGAHQVLRDGFDGPSIFDMANVSRVEIVKGPSSFLYGQVAPGGIVNVITKSPQRRFSAQADLSYGSYGQHRATADLTGPASPTLSYRLVAAYDRDMHYWEPYDAQAYTLAPSLLWQPDHRMSVTLKYEGFRKNESPQLMQKPGYGRQAGVVPTPEDPNLSGVDVPGLPDNWNSMSNVDYRRSNADGVSAWLDLVASNHWNLRAGYSHLSYEVDALFSGNFGMANNTTFLQGRRLRRQTYDNRSETGSVEAVGKYQLGDATLRMLLGAQHVRRRFDNRAGQAPNDPALGSDPTASPLPLWDLRDPSTWNREVNLPLSSLNASAADASTSSRDRSLYAGSTFDLFNERLRLLAGLRYTSSKARATNHLDGTVRQFATHKLTPQYGILYKLNPELALFASYAESFVPAQQTLNQPDGTAVPARPTEGKGYDVGLKANLLDGRVSGTLTFFDLRNRNVVNDLASTNAAGAVVINNVQSGEQRSKGVEIDTTITATKSLQFYLSYSYIDARIVEFSGNDAALLAQDPSTLDASGRANYKSAYLLHGARLPMSAPHLFNLWARYDAAHGSYVAGGVNVVRNQTLLADSPASSRQSYMLVNALAGRAWDWRGRRVSLELMGKNLTGEQYRPSQSTRARPRELVLTLRVAL